MIVYTCVQRLTSRLVVLTCPEYGQAMFTLGRLRHEASCASCGQLYPAGAFMFHPLTNKANRWHRLCEHDCIGARNCETNKAGEPRMTAQPRKTRKTPRAPHNRRKAEDRRSTNRHTRYKARLQRLGRCRQCGRKRGKDGSKSRCRRCLKTAAKLAKLYRASRKATKGAKVTKARTPRVAARKAPPAS